MKKDAFTKMEIVGIIFSISLVIATIMGGITYHNHIEGISKYQYARSDLYVNEYEESAVFNITLVNTRKEKNKEPVYEIDLTTIPDDIGNVNGEINAHIRLLPKDYETYIGNGNNTISSKVYVLKLAVAGAESRNSDDMGDVWYSISIYRYACFGEQPFSKEEKDKIIDMACEIFTKANSSFGENRDISILKDQAHYKNEEFNTIIDNRILSFGKMSVPNNFIPL